MDSVTEKPEAAWQLYTLYILPTTRTERWAARFECWLSGHVWSLWKYGLIAAKGPPADKPGVYCLRCGAEP